MLKKVITITPEASLEDAIYLMLEHKIGVLPVLDNHQLCGIITDRDVFKAFLHVSGYGTEGVRVVLEADNVVGVLAKVAESISKANLNIGRIVADTRATGKTVVELQIDGNIDRSILTEKLQATGVTVISVEATHLKANLD